MSKAIIVDTEYTTWEGALESDWSLPGQHKEIVQIAAIKVDIDDGFKELESFDVLVKPKINGSLSDFFVALTSITQETVDNKGLAFSEALTKFFDFCEQDTLPVICMSGDEAVLCINCDIHGVTFPLTRPFHRLRPYLESRGVDLQVHSSGSLHTLTDNPLQAGHVHYALHDVRSMGIYMAYESAQGRFKNLDQLPTDLPKVDPRSSFKNEP